VFKKNGVCFRGAKIPVAPEGKKWKEVRHDNTVNISISPFCVFPRLDYYDFKLDNENILKYKKSN